MHSKIILKNEACSPSLHIYIPQIFSHQAIQQNVPIQKTEYKEPVPREFLAESQSIKEKNTSHIYLEYFAPRDHLTNGVTSLSLPPLQEFICWFLEKGRLKKIGCESHSDHTSCIDLEHISPVFSSPFHLVSYRQNIETYLEEIGLLYKCLQQKYNNALIIPQRVFNGSASLDGPIFGFQQGRSFCYFPPGINIQLTLDLKELYQNSSSAINLEPFLCSPQTLVHLARQYLCFHLNSGKFKSLILDNDRYPTVLRLLLLASSALDIDIIISQELSPKKEKFLRSLCSKLGLKVGSRERDSQKTAREDFLNAGIFQAYLKNIWIGPSTWLPLMAEFFLKNFPSVKLRDVLLEGPSSD